MAEAATAVKPTAEPLCLTLQLAAAQRLQLSKRRSVLMGKAYRAIGTKLENQVVSRIAAIVTR
jgi:hypothetical protein